MNVTAKKERILKTEPLLPSPEKKPTKIIIHTLWKHDSEKRLKKLNPRKFYKLHFLQTWLFNNYHHDLIHYNAGYSKWKLQPSSPLGIICKFCDMSSQLQKTIVAIFLNQQGIYFQLSKQRLFCCQGKGFHRRVNTSLNRTILFPKHCHVSSRCEINLIKIAISKFKEGYFKVDIGIFNNNSMTFICSIKHLFL